MTDTEEVIFVIVTPGEVYDRRLHCDIKVGA